ncbi:Disulfide bond formation protein D [bacterium HR11]|nr:Disulfide bond formation protein D [bacterium HR11]
MFRRYRWIGLTAGVAGLGLLTASLLVAQQKSAPNTENLQAKVVNYIKTMFPMVQDLQVKSFTEEKGAPFYRVVLTYTAQNRSQESAVFVSRDGSFLILCQDCIYDLRMDPQKALWAKVAEGAEERMSKIKLDGRPFKGNPNAKVVVVEYSDYQCPFCRRAFEQIEPQLMQQYGDKVKFVYKQFPLPIHPWAFKASIAALCVHKYHPKAYWDLHSRLFQSQNEIRVENLRDRFQAIARELNLDTNRLLACFDKEETRPEVEADMNEAQALGVSSTPTFIINGAVVTGAIPFDQFKMYINMALANAK